MLCSLGPSCLSMVRSRRIFPASFFPALCPLCWPGVRKALNHLYMGRIYVAGPGLKTGLSIRTDDPSQLGSELVCSAIAVLADYPPPCVIISMDTAVSITALDNRGALRGGAILPGVKIALKHCAHVPHNYRRLICPLPLAGF